VRTKDSLVNAMQIAAVAGKAEVLKMLVEMEQAAGHELDLWVSLNLS
jgi:hypothetical protein